MFAVQPDHLQLLPFEHQAVAFEDARHDGFCRDVGAHFRAPEREFSFDGFVDVIHGRLRGQHLGVREGFGQGIEAEVVIRITVADVNGGQVLAAGADLFHHLFSLGFAELRVDQNGVFLTADQYRGHREDCLGARVIDIKGQVGSGRMSGEAEGGRCE